MKSKIELLAMPYTIELKDGSLAIALSPLPNWYQDMEMIDPIKSDPKKIITWSWEGEIPKITSLESVKKSGIFPVVNKGYEILSWGHHWIKIRISKEIIIVFHNFDPIE